MSRRSFITVVKNYERLAALGKEIIKHKDDIKKVKPDMLDMEFKRQEQRLQIFENDAKYVNNFWKNNKNTINEFWTGLS